MNTPRMNRIAAAIRAASFNLGKAFGKSASGAGQIVGGAIRPLIVIAGIGGLAYVLIKHPPFGTVERGDVGLRMNQLTGNIVEVHDGSVLVLPGLHSLKTYPLRDQVYRDTRSARADGEAPFQSIEGLSLGAEVSVRYKLDPARISSVASRLPDDIGGQIVQPEVQGVIYKTFTRYTVREIYSTKRAEIQQSIETELKPKLAADGIVLRGVMIGKVDLPADYRAGLEHMLEEELATEKMRYTLELKEKQVKQTELESAADAVRREKAAEAAGNEQIIAAKAQAEAMKHVLPFKEKQIQQRQLEADAEKVARVKRAEAEAEARKIEVGAEAESRQKLAMADAYRVEVIGKANSAQMERDGALLSKHPLLIQKAMADKLSDKISVIIAPPHTGGFIGANLLGGTQQSPAAAQTGEEEGGAQ